MGPGLFTIPHGPVRSGVMESIEYLVETPGEDIPHLNMRVFYKHRGIEKRFEGMTPADGVLLAERTEGVASVAHALAYCHAIERIGRRRGALAGRAGPGAARRAGTARRPPRRGDEAVPMPRAWPSPPPGSALHKEPVLRLVEPDVRQPVRPRGGRARRGQPPAAGSGPADLLAELARLERAITGDARSLMGTASFLDRLRRTGPLRPRAGPRAWRARPGRQGVRLRRRRRRARRTTLTPALGLPERLPHDGG